MANLSYLFYKGYYNGFEYWQNMKANQDKTEAFFKEKHKPLLEYELSQKSVDLIRKCKTIYKNLQEFQLKTSYPGLLIGTGYTHGVGAAGEFKIGFQFDHVTGLPIIPGSSVKGVLRSAFPQWERDKSSTKEVKEAKTKWIAELLQWKETDFDVLKAKVHALELAIFEGIKDNSEEKNEKKYYLIYKRDIFHDAFPCDSQNEGQGIFGTDSITPHSDALKNPIPLLMLKVLPQVTFEFQFQLQDYSKEKEIKVVKKEGEKWVKVANLEITATEKSTLFQTILQSLGIGAKTRVGYGRLK